MFSRIFMKSNYFDNGGGDTMGSYVYEALMQLVNFKFCSMVFLIKKKIKTFNHFNQL